MLNTSWDNNEFSFFKIKYPISKRKFHFPFNHKEQFIRLRMAMPDELSFRLYQLQLVVVEFCNQFILMKPFDQLGFLLKINNPDLH